MCVIKCKLICYSLILSVTILGCNINNRRNDALCEIDISENIDKVTSTNLSNISDNIIYIPLQTPPNLLLKSIINIRICKSGIYVCDGERIYKFSSTGKYIKEIGGVGNGPGEFIGPALLEVNEEANTLFVISENKGLLKYDLNGNYIDMFPNFGSTTNLVYQSDDIYLNESSFSNKESNIIIADTLLNVLHRFQKIKAIDGVFSFSVNLYCFNNEVFCKGAFNDTIFRICKEGLKPYIVIKLGKNQLLNDLNINDIVNENPEIVDKYFIHHNIIETKTFLLAELSTLRAIDKVVQIKYLLYDKNESTQSILPQTGFVNDINNGLPFVPRYLQNDSICVDYADAYKLIEWVNSETFKNSKPKYPEKKEALQHLVDSLDYNDNPVIMIVSLKE